MKHKDLTLHPEDFENISYWTHKWGVTARQVNYAILDTGSLKVNDIKNYLRKDIWYYSPVTGLINLFKAKFGSIN